MQDITQEYREVLARAAKLDAQVASEAREFGVSADIVKILDDIAERSQKRANECMDANFSVHGTNAARQVLQDSAV